MDSFETRVRVFNPRNPKRTEEVGVAVDPGAKFAIIPRPVGEALDLPILWRHEFDLAEGVDGPRDIGLAGFSYKRRKCPSSLAILGEDGDPALLPPGNAEDLGLVRIERMGDCPNCGPVDVIPILYGLPAPEAVQKARRGRIALGGCVTFPGMPKYSCPNCHAGLRELVARVIHATRTR